MADTRRIVWITALSALFALLLTPWADAWWSLAQGFPSGRLWLATSTYSANWFSDWLIALGVLFALVLSSELLALRITEGGSMTTMDFVPHLGAILLLGPTGAGILAVASDFTSEFILSRKPRQKATFNTAQIVISVLVAAWTFVLLGGQPALLGATADTANLPLRDTLPPFVAAVLAYFGTNTSLVSFVISRSQDTRFSDVWNKLSGRLIVFDIAMSPLGFLVAFLFLKWGAVTLLLALIPIIGLRYSYGVNLELQQLNTDLVRVLIRTLESQDPYTAGHSLRVSRWATRIAEAIDLNYRKRRAIETGALLHDVGKVGRIYFEILRQDGPLTDEQRHTIQRHPEQGVEMLSAVRSIDDSILKCVRHHHEHYGGQGYPDGLSGEEIPLGARIIMIADTIDAMMTKRPYRDPLPPRIVRQELIDKRGQQFDPELIDILMQRGLFEEIANHYVGESGSILEHESNTGPSVDVRTG